MRVCLTGLLFLLTYFPLLADTGYIQIESEPDLTIFVDGRLAGITNSELNGLIVKDVSSGARIVKAVKTGFKPKVVSIEVKSGGVALVRLDSFKPSITVTQSGEAKAKLETGNLLIQSLPVQCELYCSDLGWDGLDKKMDKFQAGGIPVGEYTIEAKALGKTLKGSVAISSGRESELFLDFVNDDFVDVRLREKIEREKQIAEQKKRREEQQRKQLELERNFPMQGEWYRYTNQGRFFFYINIPNGDTRNMEYGMYNGRSWSYLVKMNRGLNKQGVGIHGVEVVSPTELKFYCTMKSNYPATTRYILKQTKDGKWELHTNRVDRNGEEYFEGNPLKK